MKKKEREVDIMSMFKTFKSNVLDKKPTLKEMVADVRMMQFRIRPLQGDVSHIDFANEGFVETLWKLGKMDDFIERHVGKINKKQERAFFSYFDSLYYHLQDRLNSLNLTGRAIGGALQEKKHIEMEIFKIRTRTNRMN